MVKYVKELAKSESILTHCFPVTSNTETKTPVGQWGGYKKASTKLDFNYLF
ncbi:hypothetical protein FORC9_0934 [Vibrio vulnificus]|nr:hypothetical protein FORC9_0934 [Vibrio vulnificus]ANH63741.1 hypothetical protein FORC16_1858 [Vibrio vulnificus]